MRPHHGREEVHLGRWKWMESNNNGELQRFSINQRKGVLRSERTIRRLGGRFIFTRRDCSIKYNKYVDPDDKSSNNAEKKKGKRRRSREQQTLKGAIMLHCHEREELQNKRSTKRKSFKTSALLKRNGILWCRRNIQKPGGTKKKDVLIRYKLTKEPPLITSKRSSKREESLNECHSVP